MLSSADFTPQGLAVGHATDNEGFTGLTVIRGVNSAFRASAAIVGRATSTRQFDALSPSHVVDRVDAIVLCGGSAYGLDAAAGVMRWMEERGRGFSVGNIVVPIVPAAVVFDLGPLGKSSARPSAQMAYTACDSALSSGFEEGSVGAGTGATVGKVLGIERCCKGGFGAATVHTGQLTCTAVAVVNAFGNVHDSKGVVLAGARDDAGNFVDVRRALAEGRAQSRFRGRGTAGGNTTLACVALSAPLGRVQLQQLAGAAAAAIYRRISPSGTTVDGDVVFAVAPLQGEPADPMAAEALASEVLEQAIERAVLAAVGTVAVPSHSDLFGRGERGA
jgi:L-aminopeptidase/D-esterase-like protein